MLIYAGIDEAGYGPLLGPLCVACCAFRVQHDESESSVPNLWKTLNRAVCRKRTDKKHRIAIDDSKNLKGAKDGSVHPLRHLERGVLSFLHSMENSPQSDSELFRSLDIQECHTPWTEYTSALPVALDQDEIGIASSQLKRALQATGIECNTMSCQVIDVDSFNQQVEKMGNKANVNLCAAIRFVDSLWKQHTNESIRLVVDRHGGRTHYLDPLMQLFPDAEVRVIDETESRSRYRLTRNGSTLELLFMVDAEATHLPVALASMTAKYVRELHMARLNRYFQALNPELKPTAGYRQDAKRYLREIEPLIRKSGIDRRSLVRSV